MKLDHWSANGPLNSLPYLLELLDRRLKVEHLLDLRKAKDIGLDQYKLLESPA